VLVLFAYCLGHSSQVILHGIDAVGSTVPRPLFVGPVLMDRVADALGKGCVFGIGLRYVDPFIDVIVHSYRYRSCRGASRLDGIDVYVVIAVVLGSRKL
jgi:hypothetical protein